VIKELIQWLERRSLRRAQERKKLELRLAQEQYAALKAEKEAMDAAIKAQGPANWFFFNGSSYTDVCKELGRYEERVEILMREQ
jgi:hypothetical protein